MEQGLDYLATSKTSGSHGHGSLSKDNRDKTRATASRQEVKDNKSAAW